MKYLERVNLRGMNFVKVQSLLIEGQDCRPSGLSQNPVTKNKRLWGRTLRAALVWLYYCVIARFIWSKQTTQPRPCTKTIQDPVKTYTKGQHALLSGLLTVFILSGCTSATQPKLNKPLVSPTADIIPQLQDESSLKRLVAIGRFSDESKRGQSIFVDENNNRLGKQASDILSSRLTASNKFILLERSDQALVDLESGKEDQAKKIGADFLILGSVSEFGRETVSEVGIFSRNKIQKATATVNVRLVNVKTSQIVYSEEATGSASAEANQVFGVGETAAYNSALDDRAISAAISKLVANIMNNLMDMPWQAYLLSHENGNYVISGGASQGIQSGIKLNVYKPGKLVKNPQTGQFIELPGKVVGQLEVVETLGVGESEISMTRLVSGRIDLNQLNEYRIREVKG